MFQRKGEILKMLVVSQNIYVGRDFRKSFSPISLLQAGLMSTLEKGACGLLQSCSWCLRPEVSQPVQCLSVGDTVKCAQCGHSVWLPGSLGKSFSDSSAVTSGCGSASLFLKIFFSLHGCVELVL